MSFGVTFEWLVVPFFWGGCPFGLFQVTLGALDRLGFGFAALLVDGFYGKPLLHHTSGLQTKGEADRCVSLLVVNTHSLPALDSLQLLGLQPGDTLI